MAECEKCGVFLLSYFARSTKCGKADDTVQKFLFSLPFFFSKKKGRP